MNEKDFEEIAWHLFASYDKRSIKDHAIPSSVKILKQVYAQALEDAANDFDNEYRKALERMHPTDHSDSTAMVASTWDQARGLVKQKAKSVKGEE